MNRKPLSVLIATALTLGSLSMSNAFAFEKQTENYIAKDYQQHLARLWDHFHQNPELSLMEIKTAKRLAKELRAVGFEVTEKVGGTGIVLSLIHI